jgi:hypothetical protein
MYLAATVTLACIYTLPVEEKYPKKIAKKLTKIQFFELVGHFQRYLQTRNGPDVHFYSVACLPEHTRYYAYYFAPFPRIKSDQFSSLNP